jgi:hypothetical protein
MRRFTFALTAALLGLVPIAAQAQLPNPSLFGQPSIGSNPGGACAALGGDLIGTCGAATVTAIGGKAVSLAGPFSTTGAATITMAMPTSGTLTYTFPATSKTLMATDYSNGATLGTANSFLTSNGTGIPNAVAISGLVLGNGASAPSAYGGTSSAGSVLTALSAAGAGSFLAYTNADTASTLVERDSSGNFSAGTITGATVTATTLELSGSPFATNSGGNYNTISSVSGSPGTYPDIELGYTADNSIYVDANTIEFRNGAHVGVYQMGSSAFQPSSDNANTLGAAGARWSGVYAALANSATTSAVCYNTSTGAFTYDGTLGTCTTSGLWAKHIVGTLSEPTALKGIEGLSISNDVWRYRQDAEYKGRFDTRLHVGLIADDVAKMDDRCVGYRGGKVGDYDERCVIAYLVGAVKAQQREIEALSGSSK